MSSDDEEMYYGDVDMSDLEGLAFAFLELDSILKADEDGIQKRLETSKNPIVQEMALRAVATERSNVKAGFFNTCVAFGASRSELQEQIDALIERHGYLTVSRERREELNASILFYREHPYAFCQNIDSIEAARKQFKKEAFPVSDGIEKNKVEDSDED